MIEFGLYDENGNKNRPIINKRLADLALKSIGTPLEKEFFKTKIHTTIDFGEGRFVDTEDADFEIIEPKQLNPGE